MHIELNTFDASGAVSTSLVELTAEQIGAIVQRAHEVTRLRRAGASIDAALDSLDGALVHACVMEQGVHSATAQVAVSDLKIQYQALAESAIAEGCPEGQVRVSKSALDALGASVSSGEYASAGVEWKWVTVQHKTMQSQDLSHVLAKMGEAAKLGGAPSATEAMKRYPLLFCQAFAELTAEAQREAHGNTRVVHVDNGQGETLLSMGAPMDMDEESVKCAIQDAVGHAEKLEDIEGLLAERGFDRIEHIHVEAWPVPGEAMDEITGDNPEFSM